MTVGYGEYGDDENTASANWRRQKEQEATDALARATAAEAALEVASKAQRELEFLKAGIPDTPLGKMFQRGYDGPLTADAIKQAAIDAELIPRPVTSEEQQAHERLANAGYGSTGTQTDAEEAADVEAQLRVAGDLMTGSPDKILEIVRAQGGQIKTDRGDWAAPPARYFA